MIYASHAEGLRGARYCEIIASDGWLNFAVYTTQGLNDCPERFWKNITKEDIKKATGASKVILNGPRYWTMDEINVTPLIQIEKKKFKKLYTQKVAYVQLGLFDVFSGPRLYHKHEVDRDTVFTYQAGKPVYELIDSKGRAYVMQSYSVDKVKQTERSLSKLGSKLKLPKGWQFKTGTLDKTTHLKTVDKKAFVIQDDFKNSYQLASHDFLQ
ncbi:MAG: hypothetical protein K0U37_02850 [Gammaproteobacteria bacterium]|nr:hypothetical protein [Gammaproteobacteria bacterium]